MLVLAVYIGVYSQCGGSPRNESGDKEFLTWVRPDLGVLSRGCALSMAVTEVAKAETCSSQSWQKSRNITNDQWTAENREHRWRLRGNVKTSLSLPRSPSFGNVVGCLMSRSLGTGSVAFFPSFFAGWSELSGLSQVGNAVGSFFWWYFGISSSAHTQTRKCRSTTFSSLCADFFL